MVDSIVVQELITRLTLDTAQYLKNSQDIKTNTDVMKAKLRELAETSKLSFKDLGKGMIESIKGMGFEQLKAIFPQLNNDVRSVAQAKQVLATAVRTATTELTKENKELKDNTTATGQAGSATKSFGDIIKIAFGIGLGQIAVQALRNVIQLLKEATTFAFEFTKSTFLLTVGLNALRRVGVDITLKDAYTNLDKLQKKFGVFSKKELVEGAAAFMNLVRDMRFTKEEIFNLQDAVATLAVVNGRAMDEVQRTVALALSSGYTEGLQRLGVSINRVNIAIKAEELGYGRVYMSLTEAQRAEATQILILEKTAKYSEDLIEYQKTMAGQIERTTAAIKDSKVALGEGLLPAQRMWNEIVLSTVTVLGALLAIIVPIIGAFSDLWHIMEGMELTLNPKKFWEQTKQKTAEAAIAVLHLANAYYMLTHAGKNLPNLEKLMGGAEGIKKLFGEGALEVAALGATANEKAQAEADKMMDVTADLAKDLLDLQDELASDLTKAEQDLQSDLVKIDDDGWKKRLDIWADYNEKIRDIDLDAFRDTQKEKARYALDVTQINRAANQKRAEAEAKYREKEIKAEIDYQERLKKLREGFLMDLDEALHERDARQILRLIKQYNLQKEQAGRDYKINLDEMKRAHVLELQELEAQRAERLRILAEELQIRLATIQQEAAWKREEAKRDRDAKLAEAAAATSLEKAERLAKYEQELKDIQDQNQKRIDAIVQGLADQYKLTQPQLEAIAKLWESVYGKDGRIEAAFKNAIAWVNEYNSMLARLQASLSGLSMPKSGMPYPGKRRASGGIDYATKPTSLTFGEAGPEMAITMPLSRGFSGNQYLNGSPISSLSGGSKNGSIDIALLLSPDLEARIVRKSGDTVANVLLEVQRQRQR